MKKAKLVQDRVYPSMWRVQWPEGWTSDMVNKARAKDDILHYELNRHHIERRIAEKRAEEAH